MTDHEAVKSITVYLYTEGGALKDRRRYHARIAACQFAMRLAETGKMFEGSLSDSVRLAELTKSIGAPVVCAACGELILPLEVSPFSIPKEGFASG